mgnify:CR=1 FL=1
MNHKRIFLIGFMGSGKTTHGKVLAKKLGYRFMDMDRYIEQENGMSIPRIFESKGEGAFREMEKAALASLCQEDQLVIATGGGAPCHLDNMTRMNRCGLTIYLYLPPAALLQRLRDAKTKRPLIRGKSREELLDYIGKTLRDREAFYREAHIVVDGINLTTERLIKSIET